MDKTLIIIPGWGGDKSTWQQAQTLFSKHIETICIELPCFGDVPCPKDVWGVKEYANFVEQSIQALNKKNIVILGHSFGGQVATYLVAKNNTIAKKLILSGAAVYRPKRSIRRGLFLVLAKCGTLVFRLPFISQFESIAKKVLYRSAQSPDYANTEGIKRDIFKKIIREDVSNHLKDITVPTLVIWGENDNYVPLTYGKKIAKGIPKATLTVIEKGNHGLHLKHTSTFVTRIIDFIT